MSESNDMERKRGDMKGFTDVTRLGISIGASAVGWLSAWIGYFFVAKLAWGGPLFRINVIEFYPAILHLSTVLLATILIWFKVRLSLSIPVTVTCGLALYPIIIIWRSHDGEWISTTLSFFTPQSEPFGLIAVESVILSVVSVATTIIATILCRLFEPVNRIFR